MPKLEDLIGRTKHRRPKTQSWEQMRDQARMFTLLMGGKVIERTDA
jgi:hypothetical protein